MFAQYEGGEMPLTWWATGWKCRSALTSQGDAWIRVVPLVPTCFLLPVGPARFQLVARVPFWLGSQRC